MEETSTDIVPRTLFDPTLFVEQQKQAFEALRTGKTPPEHIREKPGQGGKKQKYVNIYWFTEQLGLATGFRWSSEIIDETEIPDGKAILDRLTKFFADEQAKADTKAIAAKQEITPKLYTAHEILDLMERGLSIYIKEVGCKVRVMYWDEQGTQYSHTCWGGKEVQYNRNTSQPLSLIDNRKSAESDAIKKCISYIGFGRVIYGGRDLENLGEEPE
jgi:hypothetical protein